MQRAAVQMLPELGYGDRWVEIVCCVWIVCVGFHRQSSNSCYFRHTKLVDPRQLFIINVEGHANYGSFPGETAVHWERR